MILDFESQTALEKEFILCGWLWEERYLENKSIFKGISLHTSFNNREKISYLVNTSISKENLDIPQSYYHCYSPFEVILKPNFYNFCKNLNPNFGLFIEKNVIASLYQVLTDYSELDPKVNGKISGILTLCEKDLEQRIYDDTKKWEKKFN